MQLIFRVSFRARCLSSPDPHDVLLEILFQFPGGCMDRFTGVLSFPPRSTQVRRYSHNRVLLPFSTLSSYRCRPARNGFRSALAPAAGRSASHPAANRRAGST